jgi:hypothetical protein
VTVRRSTRIIFSMNRDHINESRTAGRDYAPKPKNHSALIFLHDFDPANNQDHKDDADCSAGPTRFHIISLRRLALLCFGVWLIP